MAGNASTADTRTPRGTQWFRKATQIALLAGLTLPFVAFGRTVIRYAVNVPFQDDFDVALGFTSRFIHASSIAKKIQFVFAQHNEHRIIFCRLAFLGDYYISHEINFRDCIILGDLGWMFTVALLVGIFSRRFNLTLLQILPIPFLLLSFTHTENMFFAMAALVNYWFILFSVAFLYCLSRSKTFGILLIFPIAFFSSGGGVVLILLGNVYLAARKRWKLAGMFFGLSAVCAVAYFLNYNTPQNQPKLPTTEPQPVRAVAYALLYLGNIWSPTLGTLTDVAMSSATGLAVCAVSAFILSRRRDADFLVLMLTFVILIALAAAASRSGFGIGQALSSRYSMYPLLALTCIYVVYVSSTSRIRIRTAATVATTLAAITYWGVIGGIYDPRIDSIREKRIAVIEAFQNGDIDSLKEIFQPSAERAAAILSNAQEQGIYDYSRFEP